MRCDECGAEIVFVNLAAIDVKLGADEMAALDALDDGLVTGWDPRKAP